MRRSTVVAYSVIPFLLTSAVGVWCAYQPSSQEVETTRHTGGETVFTIEENRVVIVLPTESQKLFLRSEVARDFASKLIYLAEKIESRQRPVP